MNELLSNLFIANFGNKIQEKQSILPLRCCGYALILDKRHMEFYLYWDTQVCKTTCHCHIA